jgi:hypothetical protein
MATKEGGGYGSALGSKFTRVWSYLVKGPLSNPGLIGTTGPVGQNGGEMILEAGMLSALWIEGYDYKDKLTTADGTCSFFHRMAHTADHTEVVDLAKVIGSRPSSTV